MFHAQRARTLTNWPGQRARSAFAKDALSLMVPVVVSTALSMNCKRPGADLVIGRSGRDFQRLRGVVSADLRQQIFRHGERHVDGRGLQDGDQRGVVLFGQIALFDGDGAGAAGDGRINFGVIELQPGLLQAGAVGFLGGFRAFERGAVGFDGSLGGVGVRIGSLSDCSRERMPSFSSCAPRSAMESRFL